MLTLFNHFFIFIAKHFKEMLGSDSDPSVTPNLEIGPIEKTYLVPIKISGFGTLTLSSTQHV